MPHKHEAHGQAPVASRSTEDGQRTEEPPWRATERNPTPAQTEPARSTSPIPYQNQRGQAKRKRTRPDRETEPQLASSTGNERSDRDESRPDRLACSLPLFSSAYRASKQKEKTEGSCLYPAPQKLETRIPGHGHANETETGNPKHGERTRPPPLDSLPR